MFELIHSRFLRWHDPDQVLGTLSAEAAYIGISAPLVFIFRLVFYEKRRLKYAFCSLFLSIIFSNLSKRIREIFFIKKLYTLKSKLHM